MANPISSFLTSKQAVIAGVCGAAGLVGALAVGADIAWLAGVSLFVAAGLFVLMIADLHRKVGRLMAESRSERNARKAELDAIRDTLFERSTLMVEQTTTMVEITMALQASVTEFEQRLDAIERARQSAVSELATLRSQLITRLDLLSKGISQDIKQLTRAADVARDTIRTMDSGRKRIVRLLDRASDGLESEMVDLHESVMRSIEEASSEGVDRIVTETDALLQLHRRLGIEQPVPLVGGWAMTAVGMKTLVDLATQPDVATIVECGSGTSTIYLAIALARANRFETRIISLEHLEEHAVSTRSQLAALDSGVDVEVRLAPLESVRLGGSEFNWYSAVAFEDLSEIDLLLVDGPPKATGPMARFPAFPLLRSRLSSEAIVVLDDTNRDEERRIANRWMHDQSLVRRREYPSRLYVLEYHST